MVFSQKGHLLNTERTSNVKLNFLKIGLGNCGPTTKSYLNSAKLYFVHITNIVHNYTYY